MLSERQELLLDSLIKQYITTAEPVGSLVLKKSANLNISPATVRNDLQELTREGYIEQPHTSAGRVPTKKAYQYFAHKSADQEAEFIYRQTEATRRELEKEMKLAKELTSSLEKVYSSLRVTQITNNGNMTEILEIISFSKTHRSKNQKSINDIIQELENL